MQCLDVVFSTLTESWFKDVLIVWMVQETARIIIGMIIILPILEH